MAIQKLQPAAILVQPGKPGPVSKGVPGRCRSHLGEIVHPVDGLSKHAQPVKDQQLPLGEERQHQIWQRLDRRHPRRQESEPRRRFRQVPHLQRGDGAVRGRVPTVRQRYGRRK